MSDAVEAFKQAIQLKPDFGKAYFNLGKSFLAMKTATLRWSNTTSCKTWIRTGRRS